MTRAAVVGGGVMGAAAARALGAAGHRVILFERYEVGHAHGSSHGTSRIFRLSYRSAEFVGMAQEALGLWRALERDAGETLLTTLGGLDGGEGIESNVEALSAAGAEFERIDGAEAMRRWPQFGFDAHTRLLYQPDGGVIAANRAWRALLGEAARRGVEIRERVRVTRLEPEGDGVVVVSDEGRVPADVAVVTAGSWARPLLAAAGIELPVRPTRETIAHFRLDGPQLPPLVEWSDTSAYALPSPGIGIKAGRHMAGPTVDPETAAAPDPAVLDVIVEWVGRRYPAAAPTPELIETCMYTNTEDERFVLRRHGAIVVGSPCSGHGFKFAPLIGVRLAALAG